MSIENSTIQEEDAERTDNQKQTNELVKNLTDPKENFDKVEEVMADLQVIMSIEDPEIQKKAMQVFIKKRLKELEKEVPEKQNTLSLIGNRTEGKFIHPETEIKRSWTVDGFKVNDPEIYTVLLENFRKFYKHWNNPNLRSITGH